ncbi:hypothetical protein UT300012_24000 [Paraclostridium bifermentans]
MERGNLSPTEGKEVMKAGNKGKITSVFTQTDESDLLQNLEYDWANEEVVNLEGVGYERVLCFSNSSMRVYLDENGSLVTGIAFTMDKISDKDMKIIQDILSKCMSNSDATIALMLATLDKYKDKVLSAEDGATERETYDLGGAQSSITITPEYASNGAYKRGIVQITDKYNLEQPLSAE